jgi:hypothetical protein
MAEKLSYRPGRDPLGRHRTDHTEQLPWLRLPYLACMRPLTHRLSDLTEQPSIRRDDKATVSGMPAPVGAASLRSLKEAFTRAAKSGAPAPVGALPH